MALYNTPIARKKRMPEWIVFCMLLLIVANGAIAQEAAKSKEALNSKDQSVIKISGLTAIGNLTTLKTELKTGLEAGLTVNEIKEVLVHTYAYCGFPRSIRGLQTFMELIEERKSKGINNNIGKEASPVLNERNKYDRGKKILGELTGVPQPDKLSGYSAFSPTIDTFLKEHLFADIFERDVLTYAQRELVTIAVIAAIGEADPMLKSHLNISLRVGWSPDQMKEFLTVISPIIGEDKSTAARATLTDVLASSKSSK